MYMTNRGMTLIEAIVWMTVFIFALGATVASIRSFYRANAYTFKQAQAVEEIRRGTEGAVEAIREAGYGSNGAYPVISMGEHAFSFYSDIDSDPFVERIRYFLEEDELRLGIIDPTGDPPLYDTESEVVTTAALHVRNAIAATSTFQYFDAEGNEIADYGDITQVRFVRLMLIVNTDPDNLPDQIVIRSSATMRNIR